MIASILGGVEPHSALHSETGRTTRSLLIAEQLRAASYVFYLQASDSKNAVACGTRVRRIPVKQGEFPDEVNGSRHGLSVPLSLGTRLDFRQQFSVVSSKVGTVRECTYQNGLRVVRCQLLCPENPPLTLALPNNAHASMTSFVACKHTTVL